MKKFVLAALIGATILTPTMAIAQERGQWRGRGGGEAREQRQPGAERPMQQQRDAFRAQREQFRAQREQQPQFQRPERPERPQFQRPERPERPNFQRPDRPERPDFQRPQRPEGTSPQWRQRPDGRQDWQRDRGQDRRDWQRDRDQNRRDWQRDRNEGRRDWQRDRDDARRDWQRDRRDDRRDWRDGRRDGDWRNRGDRGGNWNRGWRQDRRYDWSDYRARNRNVYRLPRYYAPRGYNYGYQRFSIGLTLGAMLFSSNYWINDPYTYRLPPADGPYRWVRYYNDALLVDTYTGEVIDVEYDIFW